MANMDKRTFTIVILSCVVGYFAGGIAMLLLLKLYCFFAGWII
jgi:hypothetical protein|tara:strand:+ start:519 stop:647 length:129 start_codon:yes stop_codon:yes gene_type:complete